MNVIWRGASVGNALIRPIMLYVNFINRAEYVFITIVSNRTGVPNEESLGLLLTNVNFDLLIKLFLLLD